MALTQEYIRIPRMRDEDLYKFYFKLTHPSFTYADKAGNEIDIRDVMRMDFREVDIVPRNSEIGKMWDEYSKAYLDYEKGIENAIEKINIGQDMSHDETVFLENAIDTYNRVYKDITRKEEDTYGYIIRDRRNFLDRIIKAYYLGGKFKQLFMQKGGGINLSHIASKEENRYNHELVSLNLTNIEVSPILFTQKECDICFDTIDRIWRGEYDKELKDVTIILEKSRQNWINEHHEDYYNNRYIFLDEDRMGLYRMILETGLSKEEIWKKLGYDENGGNFGVGDDKDYIYHTWD